LVIIYFCLRWFNLFWSAMHGLYTLAMLAVTFGKYWVQVSIPCIHGLFCWTIRLHLPLVSKLSTASVCGDLTFSGLPCTSCIFLAMRQSHLVSTRSMYLIPLHFLTCREYLSQIAMLVEAEFTLGKYWIHASDSLGSHWLRLFWEYPYVNHHSPSQITNLFLLGLPVEIYQQMVPGNSEIVRAYIMQVNCMNHAPWVTCPPRLDWVQEFGIDSEGPRVLAVVLRDFLI